VWVTGEALMAMEGKPLPIAAPAPPAAPTQPASSSHTTTSAHSATAAPSNAGGHAGATKRAPAHTTAHRHGLRPVPAIVKNAIARNQVLAGNFAGTVGVLTALALAPVGLG
jgi:hypothetical protein